MLLVICGFYGLSSVVLWLLSSCMPLMVAFDVEWCDHVIYHMQSRSGFDCGDGVVIGFHGVFCSILRLLLEQRGHF